MQVHRIPNRGEVRLAYAEDSSGVMVHVGSVARGLACACVCPACGRAVEAKQGERRASHFAHESNSDCVHAVETMLHKLAKRWLAQRGSIAVPELEAHWRQRSRVVIPRGTFDYAVVSLEHRISDIIPDVVLQQGSTSILVEIVVTNPCDGTKLEKLRAIGLPAMEIDLSGYFHGMAEAELERVVLQTAPRKWVFHPSLDAAVAGLREDHEKDEMRKREQEQRRVESVRKSRRQDTNKANARLRILREEASVRSNLQNLGIEAQTPEGREAILDRVAREKLGRRADEWTLRPCRSLEGITPRAFARASAEHLRQALHVVGR